VQLAGALAALHGTLLLRGALLLCFRGLSRGRERAEG
jgi:hypothetical protein